MRRLHSLDEDWAKLNARALKLEEEHRSLNDLRSELKRSIAENGGDRIERLTLEISKLDSELNERQRKARALYRTLFQNQFETSQRCRCLFLSEEANYAIDRGNKSKEASSQNHLANFRSISENRAKLVRHFNKRSPAFALERTTFPIRRLHFEPRSVRHSV